MHEFMLNHFVFIVSNTFRLLKIEHSEIKYDLGTYWVTDDTGKVEVEWHWPGNPPFGSPYVTINIMQGRLGAREFVLEQVFYLSDDAEKMKEKLTKVVGGIKEVFVGTQTHEEER